MILETKRQLDFAYQRPFPLESIKRQISDDWTCFLPTDVFFSAHQKARNTRKKTEFQMGFDGEASFRFGDGTFRGRFHAVSCSNGKWFSVTFRSLVEDTAAVIRPRAKVASAT